MEITEIIARMTVKLRSAAGARRSGTCTGSPPCSPRIKMDPTPGNRLSQFEIHTKRKMVATSGRYRSASLRLPKTDSMSPRTLSRINSAILWNFPGMIESFFRKRSATTTKKRTVTTESNTELVMGSGPRWNIVSALNEISGIRAHCIIPAEKNASV